MGGVGSGGARNRSGPAPDLAALRRERDWKGFTRLPKKGRTRRDVPPWPDTMPDYDEDQLRLSKAEKKMWERLWLMPQAAVWEADGMEDLVALYVRSYLEAAEIGASAGLRTWVKQAAGTLMLTSEALTANRYVIVDEAHAATGLSGHQRKPVATAAGVVGGLSVVPPLMDVDEDEAPSPGDDD